MLHTLNPARFCTIQQLTQQWECCECRATFVFGQGWMFVAHYIDRQSRETHYGLMNFCSKECILKFEHQTYMGKC